MRPNGEDRPGLVDVAKACLVNAADRLPVHENAEYVEGRNETSVAFEQQCCCNIRMALARVFPVWPLMWVPAMAILSKYVFLFEK